MYTFNVLIFRLLFDDYLNMEDAIILLVANNAASAIIQLYEIFQSISLRKPEYTHYSYSFRNHQKSEITHTM